METQHDPPRTTPPAHPRSKMELIKQNRFIKIYFTIEQLNKLKEITKFHLEECEEYLFEEKKIDQLKINKKKIVKQNIKKSKKNNSINSAQWKKVNEKYYKEQQLKYRTDNKDKIAISRIKCLLKSKDIDPTPEIIEMFLLKKQIKDNLKKLKKMVNQNDNDERDVERKQSSDEIIDEIN